MENKIEVSLDNVKKIEVHYKKPQHGLWMIACSDGHSNKHYALAEYRIYGKELISGEDLIYYTHAPRGYNFSVIEKGFKTKEEAEKRLKEIRNETNTL